MNFKKISKIRNTLRLNKRGVSPIIATLLLVAIAVAASVITYTWVMSMTANQAQKSQTQISTDQVFFGRNSTATSGAYGISLNVRNSGSVSATIQSITIMQGDKVIVSKTGLTNTVQASSYINLGITNASAWDSTTGFTSGGLALPTPATIVPSVTFLDSLSVIAPYKITIQTANGFTAEGTFYTPGSW